MPREVEGFLARPPAFRWGNEGIQKLADAQQPKMKEPSHRPAQKALPGLRMKNVRLGDIMAVYKPGKLVGGWKIVDFRPPKVGEVYLNKRYSTERAMNPSKSPRLILEHVEAKGELE